MLLFYVLPVKCLSIYETDFIPLQARVSNKLNSAVGMNSPTFMNTSGVIELVKVLSVRGRHNIPLKMDDGVIIKQLSYLKVWHTFMFPEG